jgi:putative ABC transport system permease protein
MRAVRASSILRGASNLLPNHHRLKTRGTDAAILLVAERRSLALTTGLIVGLLPALRQSRADHPSTIGDEIRGTAASSPRRRLRGLLVTAEVTIAVVVLTGAILLIRSFAAMSRASAGFAASGTAVAQLSIPRASYDTPEKVFAFHESMVERPARMPDVLRASAVYPLPLAREDWSGSVGIAGLARCRSIRTRTPSTPSPCPATFQTVGIPMFAGRDFALTDSANAPAVAIVDTVFVRRYWPGQSAIGKRISTSGDTEKGPFETVVGVVGHVRSKGARVEGEPQLYLPALQKSELSLFFVARASGDPRGLLPSIRQAVSQQDSRLPVAILSTGAEVVNRFTARDRFNVLLFSMFGIVSLLLAAIGLYGVLAFLVTERTHEIGIRPALGGCRATVVRGVVGEALGLTLGGLVFGIGGGLQLAYGMKDLLFQIEPADPQTYLAIACSMIAAALVAAFGPAMRGLDGGADGGVEGLRVCLAADRKTASWQTMRC